MAYELRVSGLIDYQWATPGLAEHARTAAVYKDERFSDHAPLTVDYGFER